MTIPFKIKLLTETAKPPHRNCESDLWDLYADGFCVENLQDCKIPKTKLIKKVFSFRKRFVQSRTKPERGYLLNAQFTDNECTLFPQGRILIKTGIAIELPKYCNLITEASEKRQPFTLDDPNPSYTYYERLGTTEAEQDWFFNEKLDNIISEIDNITYHDTYTIQKYAVADIRSRSGIALKQGITVLNTPGTIDNSYRQEIGVILINHGHEPYTIRKGDKICQMLIRSLEPSEMEVVDKINSTDRGGFGSTGK